MAERLINLKKILNNIQDLNCEIIITEQGSEPKAKDLVTTPNKFIFINNQLPFNKSWEFNCALEEVSNEIIVFGRWPDNLINPSDLQKSIDEMNNYDFISPHKRLIDLTEKENNLEFEEIFKIDRPGRVS
jgi:hypothetical protein